MIKYIKLYTVIYVVYCDIALSSALHAYGHLWIYDLMGTYTIGWAPMLWYNLVWAFGPGGGNSKEKCRKCNHTVIYPSWNLAHADMYGYLDISKHIHTKPRLMDNFHGYVTRIWICWISTMDIQLDIHCGYPAYPNSHQVDHHGISIVIRSG